MRALSSKRIQPQGLDRPIRNRPSRKIRGDTMKTHLLSFLKNVDQQIGNWIIDAYVDTQRVQYQAPTLEKDDSRLYRRGKF